jgi:hypothetical protein
MPDDGDVNAALRTLEKLTPAHVRRGRPAMTHNAMQSEQGQENASSNAFEKGVSTDKGLCFSFCFKSHAVVKKLISNPSGTARICDECLAVWILKDETAP